MTTVVYCVMFEACFEILSHFIMLTIAFASQYRLYNLIDSMFFSLDAIKMFVSLDSPY